MFRWWNNRREERHRLIIAEAIWAYQECGEQFGPLHLASPDPASMHELVRRMTFDQAECIRRALASHGQL